MSTGCPTIFNFLTFYLDCGRVRPSCHPTCPDIHPRVELKILWRRCAKRWMRRCEGVGAHFNMAVLCMNVHLCVGGLQNQPLWGVEVVTEGSHRPEAWARPHTKHTAMQGTTTTGGSPQPSPGISRKAGVGTAREQHSAAPAPCHPCTWQPRRARLHSDIQGKFGSA